MELLTDILAIAGWALLSQLIAYLSFRNAPNEKILNRRFLACSIFGALSFGLIAASLVLG